MILMYHCIFFFFQAEDGIRDLTVTGVQTCALPICIVVVCLGYRGGAGWNNFATTFTGAKGGIVGFMAALVAGLWAYDGWDDLKQVSGEIHDTERHNPIALIVGVAMVGAIYVLANAG